MDETELARIRARARAAAGQSTDEKPAYKGTILPFSTGQDGKSYFDMTAGIPGMLIEGAKAVGRAVTLPGEVYRGDVDLNTDNATGRVLEAATVFSPVTPGVRNLMKPGKVAPPSADDLIETGGRQFDALRKTGVDYKSSSVGQLASKVKKGLIDDGILDIADGGAPSTHKILDQLANPPDGSVANIAQLDAARRAASNIATKATSPVERGAARRLERELSGLIERADPQDVVAGPAAEAGRLAKSARQNYAAGKRSDTLFGIERGTELQAAAANSGQNQGNNIRQRLAALLKDKKVRPGKPITGFTAEETRALEEVVRGTRTRNSLRYGANVLGGGGGLGMAVGGSVGAAAGAAAGGPGGAAIGATIPPLVGATMKAGERALTRRALRQVDQMTRRRSPLFLERQANPPMTPVTKGRAAALSRALLLLEAEERARQK